MPEGCAQHCRKQVHSSLVHVFCMWHCPADRHSSFHAQMCSQCKLFGQVHGASGECSRAQAHRSSRRACLHTYARPRFRSNPFATDTAPSSEHSLPLSPTYLARQLLPALKPTPYMRQSVPCCRRMCVTTCTRIQMIQRRASQQAQHDCDLSRIQTV